MQLTDEERELFADIPADALYETWETLNEKSLELGRVITDHCHETGEGFDRMVVIPRGGYYPANILARELNFTSTEILHACIGSYKQDQAARGQSLEIGQMPLPEEVVGKRLLIIEEVCDTGHTLKYLHDYLLSCGATTVRSAVLHYKQINNATGYKPDWWITETDKWIVYPYETNERRGRHSIARQPLST